MIIHDIKIEFFKLEPETFQNDTSYIKFITAGQIYSCWTTLYLHKSTSSEVFELSKNIFHMNKNILIYLETLDGWELEAGRVVITAASAEDEAEFILKISN